MTNEQRLLREIALAAERAYRRGFQQGFLAAQGRLGADPPTDEQVRLWRFEPVVRSAKAPPGSGYAGQEDDLIDRLGWETCLPDTFPELLRLFRAAERPGEARR